MRAVVQRVECASITVDSELIAAISKGLLVFVGIGKADLDKDVDYIKKKILNLRIFENERGLFHYNVQDIQGEILLVSQFTLYGDCRNGNRPSFTQSMPVETARSFYERVVQSFKKDYSKTQSGQFQAMMKIQLVNDGPVTITIDSQD